MADRNYEDPRIRVTVRLSTEARDAFKQLAVALGCDASQLHRQAFTEFLHNHNKHVDA
jgi:predicted transcriptional regulator